ncbi:hypothetical protein QI7_0127 [Clostridioides difficile 6042]|nr:hypothetical protein QGU_3843 [Clostridioides difficile 655]EQG01701.1 hypothetical protein QI7_0127 [Clostridioides difficile 6042]EQI54492.1 hypothetical protein QQ9_3811 [Clostridioides difficile Y312]
MDVLITELFKFKYISCYCLTNQLLKEAQDQQKFKYISCYCLTHLFNSIKDNIVLFKYISCYCLTNTLRLEVKCAN